MNTLKIILLLVLLALITACQRDTSPQADLQAPSLKDNLPIMFAEAKKWDQSAYLYSATVPVLTGAFSWKMRAAFNSSSKPYESILLTLSSTGAIELDAVNHSSADFQREPINDGDWLIDSDDALKIFISADDSIEEFLKSSRKHCSDITLERFSPDNREPVVWSLSLFDCVGNNRYYYLDPKTGDLLYLSRSVIPDAILVTPSP